ncbi:MAG TPA: hypothetical protein VH054_11535 [Polyangiaceae bacterium]|nr:hypothetical protein [Polyangiaceae bacterium]
MRLQIALVMTGSISNARMKRVMKRGENVPDSALDEVRVMCAWDVYDKARKARVRATLRRYFGETHITFIGVSNADADLIERVRDANYDRIVTSKRSNAK